MKNERAFWKTLCCIHEQLFSVSILPVWLSHTSGQSHLSPKGNWKELNNEFDSVFTGCALGACSQPRNLGNGWGVVCNSHSWLVFLEVILFFVFSVRKGWGHLYPVQLFQVRPTERSCSGVAAKSILAFFGQFNDPSEGNNETLKAFWYFTKLFYVKKPAELNWVVKQSIIRRQIGFNWR